MNAAHERLLRYFKYDHLPIDLQSISEPCCALAQEMVTLLDDATDPAEVTVGLRKLLEAKDAFVRSVIE
jgi:hypothetical protein